MRNDPPAATNQQFPSAIIVNIASIFDACRMILEEQCEPQSSYWLASQMLESRLWRASEADVQAALAGDIKSKGEASLFMRVAEEVFALRSWAAKQGLKEYHAEARSEKRRRSSAKEEASLSSRFPGVAKWVQSHGSIEIGSQDSVGFIVRALDDGGLIFETDRCTSLDQSMAALERGIRAWLKRQGSNE